MKKKELRKDFLWGAALSNVQAEGGYLEDGKGLNVYDTLVVTPEPGIESQYSDTKVATDHYHHFKELILMSFIMTYSSCQSIQLNYRHCNLLPA